MQKLPAIFTRHGLAALSVFLVSHGYAAQATNTVEIVTGLCVMALSVVWSWLSKITWHKGGNPCTPLASETVRGILGKLAGALASQGIAALSAWLALTPDGKAVDVNNPEALALFLGNLTASRLGWHQWLANLKGARAAALCAASLSLMSCAQREAWKQAAQRVERAVIEAGRAVTLESAQAALDTLKAELAAAQAAPVASDWKQRAQDQARVATLKAAIELGEEKLAQLRGGKAPREVTPRTAFQVSGFRFDVLTNHLRGRCFGNSAGWMLTPNTARQNAVERPVLTLCVVPAARSTSLSAAGPPQDQHAHPVSTARVMRPAAVSSAPRPAIESREMREQGRVPQSEQRAVELSMIYPTTRIGREGRPPEGARLKRVSITLLSAQIVAALRE